MPPLCLFICLFILVPWHHVLLDVFGYFSFWIVSVVDKQQADTKSNCTHCIRRGLGRRLRSSLLLNSSPSTSRDTSLSQLVLVEIHQSLPKPRVKPKTFVIQHELKVITTTQPTSP